MVNIRKDLTGRIFGRLTVLRQAEDYVSPDGRHHCQWLCECSCENKPKVVVRGVQLHSKKTQSCGCLQIERTRESNIINKKKYNTYDLSGEYGIGYTNKGEEFYFDLEDYDKIKDYSWHIGANGYIAAKRINNSNKNVFMHRVVLGLIDVPYKEVEVDHIHGKETRNDNRKCNLRVATNSQNQMNKGLKSDNTSGVTGVNWNKRIGKWHSRITKNKNEIHLGFYDNFEDAVKARKEAEEKYFENWSYDNSQAMR